MKGFFGFFYVCVQADWFAQEEIVIAIIQSSVNPINIIKKEYDFILFRTNSCNLKQMTPLLNMHFHVIVCHSYLL